MIFSDDVQDTITNFKIIHAHIPTETMSSNYLRITRKKLTCLNLDVILAYLITNILQKVNQSLI